MWLNLSGNATDWQCALGVHLATAEDWLHRQLRHERDVEEAVQEALVALCLKVARQWKPGTGLRAALRHVVAHVRAGHLAGGLGRGYGARRHRIRTRSLPRWREESLHGRELSPVQGAAWEELKGSVPPLLSIACERIASGDSLRETARATGIQHDTLKRRLAARLEGFKEIET